MEVVKREKMQQYGEFQSQNVPRPFTHHKGVFGGGFLAQIHVVSAGEVVGAADDGNGELRVQEYLPPRAGTGNIAQSQRGIHRAQNDETVGDAVLQMVIHGRAIGDFGG